MSNIEFDVLIDKREGLKFHSYDLLRNFHHANAIPLLDYYYQADKFGRLVIPKVHFSFQSWFEKEGKNLLFDEMGHMTVMLENMIIEYCDLVESLLKKKLIIKNFDMDNVFVNVYVGVPTLCVLLTEVTEVECIGVQDRNLAWDCPRKLMVWCENQCDIKMDKLTKRFCNFLGKSNCNVRKLKKYPHNWDDVTKGEYLMSLVDSNHSQMRFLLNDSGLTWPFSENLPQRSDNLPELLQAILDWDELERNVGHNILDFFSYVIVLRNCYKHFEDLPKKIKDKLISRKTLIEYIELWQSDFWIKVYERLG
ncbi:hypothetical protein SEVIR_6G076400v4 [Setaria viridis]